MLKMNRRNLLQRMAGSLAFSSIGLSYEPQAIAKPSVAKAPSFSDGWLDDIIWVKANEFTGHHSTVRLSLPVSVDYKKPRILTFFDSLVTLKKENIFEGMFYHYDQLYGLSSRYSTLDINNAQCAVNVIDGGGKRSGALTSAWAIVWSAQTIFGITRDGLPPQQDGDVGLVTMDYRYAVRIANIDDKSDVVNLLNRAILRLPTISVGFSPERRRAVIYVNAEIFERLNKPTKFRTFNVRNVPLRSDESLVV